MAILFVVLKSFFLGFHDHTLFLYISKIRCNLQNAFIYSTVFMKFNMRKIYKIYKYEEIKIVHI